MASGSGLARIEHLYERGKAWGYHLETEELRQAIARELHSVLTEINPLSDLQAVTAHAGELLDATFLLGISLDLWDAQNQLLDAFADLAAADPVTEPLRAAVAKLAARLKLSPDLLGWQA